MKNTTQHEWRSNVHPRRNHPPRHNLHRPRLLCSTRHLSGARLGQPLHSDRLCGAAHHACSLMRYWFLGGHVGRETNNFRRFSPRQLQYGDPSHGALTGRKVKSENYLAPPPFSNSHTGRPYVTYFDLLYS